MTNVTAPIPAGGDYHVTRSATYVIAGSDAPAHVKAQADRVCTGTADDVVIQAVIDALTLGRTVKEKIVLLGDFTTAAQITLASYLILDATSARISLAAGSNCNMFLVPGDAQDIDIVGGIFDGNGTSQVGNWMTFDLEITAGVPTRVHWDGCTFLNAAYEAIDLDGTTNCCVEHCYFNGSGYGHLRLHASEKTKVVNNIFGTFTTMMAVSCDGRYNTIAGNTFLDIPTDKYAIYLTADGTLSVEGNEIVDNVFIGNYPTVANPIGVFFATMVYTRRTIIKGNVFYKLGEGVQNGGQNTLISGNQFIECNRGFYGAGSADTSFTGNTLYGGNTGVRLATVSATKVDNNHFHDIAQIAVRLQGAIDTDVDGNVFHDCGNLTNNTYAVISVEKDYSSVESSNVVIANSHVYSDVSNKPSYFVRDVDSATGYFVHDNKVDDLGTGFVNHALSGVVKDNQGYVAPGEVRTASGSLVPTGTCTATTVTGTFTESPAALKPGVNTLHCTASGTLSVVMPAGSSAVVTSGDATVTDSPKACPAGATTVVTVATGAGADDFTITVKSIAFAWHNPEAQDIYIKKVVAAITTKGGTATSIIDVGIADDAIGTNAGVEFFDDIDADAAAAVHDSWVAGDGGAQTKWVLCQDSASATDGWVVGEIKTEIANNLAGSYYIEYVGK